VVPTTVEVKGLKVQKDQTADGASLQKTHLIHVAECMTSAVELQALEARAAIKKFYPALIE
jgi:hypothetical protein